MVRISEPREGKQSPWGKIQTVRKVADGIWWVSTPGHGGVKLNRTRNAQVPKYMRMPGGWYEEDCEWAIPAIVFKSEFETYENYLYEMHKDNGYPKQNVYEMAIRSLKDWNPESYERYFNVKLQEGESYKHDKEIFHERHKNDYVVVSAITNKVNESMVDCTATLGAQRHVGTPVKHFLIPSEEYNKRSPFGYVVDTEKYTEVS